MEDNMIRLSGIIHESLVNGPGIRRVFFSQGCKHNCKECFNPETHNFDGGELRNMDELIEDLKSNPIITGVTFSGGDPFEQADKFSYMAQKIKALGLNIWCYTGYKFEYILSNLKDNEAWDRLINNIDVLVDGRFEITLRDESIKYRGSSNQRVIDVKSSLSGDEIITLY
ncbi:anaerobic ribonucleoside-triphosphate reductase-activating protein [Clostridium zeae]|uniref:Anaerobic ribonucleoside-triphosphate reductase-activating protein n=1 Tax=Clostridium zeae TaxID=2759022 RepID=A0ABQ1EHP4_9CLOT|nr:anaerobic ribonucleoside-triphosphate reductase activating protein [Clostridium zeae]GFZ34140.1 anaerobic ribonucleoside-triphosphate reductase-activating protein [Clostridium zeae]